MHFLLRVLNQRAKEYDWNDDRKGILNIPEDHRDPRSKRHYMPDEYGQVSLEKIATYENSYLGGNTREVQNSYMLFQCLMNSISREARIKVEGWDEEFIVENNAVTNVPSGNLLLKIIIRESHLDTNATTQSIRNKLSNLNEYISTIGNDITKFNGYVKALVLGLNARGLKTEDLLSNLFKGYMAVSDKSFIKYIASKLEKYEEGEDKNPNKLMQLADNKFHLLKEKSLWDDPSIEEEKIMVLKAEVQSLKKLGKKLENSSSKPSPKVGGRGTRTNKESEEKRNPEEKTGSSPEARLPKPDWMHKRPKEEDLLKP